VFTLTNNKQRIKNNKMKIIFKLAWRNIWRNKRRTYITIASVFFSVFLTILFSSLNQGLFENMIDSSVGQFSGYIQIQNPEYFEDKIIDNSLETSEALESKIVANENVEAALPRVESFALAASNSLSKGTMVVGADFEKERLYNQLDERVVEGTYNENNANAIMIGDGLAKYLNVKVGDTLILMGQGYHGSSAAGIYPIQAILKYGTPNLSKQIVFLPILEAQHLFGLENKLSSFNLILKNKAKAKKTTLEINEQLKETLAENRAYNWEETSPEIISLITAANGKNAIFKIILYAIVAFGMFGTSLMMLSERTEEFRVLVSIGMKRLLLAVTVYLEIIILSLLGALLAVLASFPVAFYFFKNPIPIAESMSAQYEQYGIEAVLPFSIDAQVFTNEVQTILILAAIIAIYAFVKILNFNPIESKNN